MYQIKHPVPSENHDSPQEYSLPVSMPGSFEGDGALIWQLQPQHPIYMQYIHNVN